MSADDGLSISNFEVKPGETKTVSVVLNNASAVAGFQFDLVLPAGITLTNAELSSARTSGAYTINQKTLADGSVRFLVMPESYESVFDGSTGEVMTLTLAVADDAEGNASIVLKNQILTVVNADSFDDYPAEATTTEVTIASAFLVGDVNGDGKVGIGDVAELINFITGKTSSTKGNADIDGNGTVDVNDIDALVTILLSIQDD